MVVEYKEPDTIREYEATDSSFTDFKRFRGDESMREEQKRAFIEGREYTPSYDYLGLDLLIDDEELRKKKSEVYEAVLELEANIVAPGVNAAEVELYRDFHGLRLKRIMLVEAARDILQARTSASAEIARASFMELNEEVYGAFDTETYARMLATELKRVIDFHPSTENSKELKVNLQKALSTMRPADEIESNPMSEERLKVLHDVLIRRYSAIFEVIPDTDDTVYYGADECVEIMNHALEAGDLAKYGWKAVLDPTVSNPTTRTASKQILLPSDIQRTAAQLRRLIIHEQEVHARRGENGIQTNFQPLARGTADYADVEEGLGVLLECAVAGNFDNKSFYRARDRYITAGLALGADGSPPRDARQVFEILWRILALRDQQEGNISEETIQKSKEEAYTHVENAFRGTNFHMRGIIYTKLKVYYEGLIKNAKFFEANIEDMNIALDVAMVGKYDHTDQHEVELISTILEDQRIII